MAATATPKKPAAKPAFRKTTAKKPTSAKTQAKATATSAKTTAKKAEAEAKSAFESYTDDAKAYAEKAALVPVGIALEVRDGVVDFIDKYSSTDSIEAGQQVRGKRGKTFSNKVERDLKQHGARVPQAAQGAREELQGAAQGDRDHDHQAAQGVRGPSLDPERRGRSSPQGSPGHGGRRPSTSKSQRHRAAFSD